MSVEQDAKAAAIAAHPNDVVREGDARASRIPYANGYIRGFADGRAKASAHLAAITDAEVDAAAAALYFEDCGVAPDAAVLADEEYDARFRAYARVAVEAARQAR